MSTRSPGQPPTCSLPSREVVDAKAIHGVVPQKRVALDERQAKQIELSRVGGRSPSAVSQADRSLGMGRPAWSMRRRWLHQLFHAVNTLSEGSRRAPGLPLRKSSLVRSVPDSDDLAVVAGVLNLPN